MCNHLKYAVFELATIPRGVHVTAQATAAGEELFAN
jgi:hypothetical protein